MTFLLPPVEREEFLLREAGVLDDSPASSNYQTPPSLRRLLDETSDIIESPPFAHVLTLLLDSAFQHLLNKKVLSGAFTTPTLHNDTVSALAPQEPVNRAVLLPKILSVLTRQAHVIGNGMPNEYLQEMEGVRDLEAFAAVVYSSNWESEIRPDEEEGGFVPSAVGGGENGNGGIGEGGPDGEGVIQRAVEESLVMVDPSASLESAWSRATG